jgi:hypothetical protein
MKCLYRAAKRKKLLELWRDEAPRGVANLRRDRQSMSQTRKQLETALMVLAQAHVDNLTGLRLVEGSLFDLERDQSFAKIISYLRDAIECAEKWKLVFDGLISPELREKDERKRAKTELAAGVAAGTIVSHSYPVGEKSPDIDHWFIGAAAECLDQYKTERAKRIPRYNQIIYELFKVVDGRYRSFESIDRELRRQRKAGRPKFLFPTRPPGPSVGYFLSSVETEPEK